MPLRTVLRWCEPKSVLLVSEMCGEPQDLLGLVRQLKTNRAEILFLRPSQTAEQQRADTPLPGPTAVGASSRGVHDELGRALRWAELLTECTLVSPCSIDEIPALAASSGVSRVVFGNCRELFKWNALTGAAGTQILNALTVPALVLGKRLLRATADRTRLRQILVPISFAHDPRPQLRLACLLARKNNARLKVLHVFTTEDAPGSHQLRTPVAVGAHLPLVELAHEGFLYPFQVSVAEGVPERVILETALREESDLVVLGGPAEAESMWRLSNSVFSTLLGTLPCPLIVAGRALGADDPVKERPFAMRTAAIPPRSDARNREGNDAVC